MIIIDTDDKGNVTVQQVEDLPSNYTCPEWLAYDAACDEAQASGESWTDKQAETYAAYDEARKRNFQ